MGSLPPVFIEFLGKATGFHATAKGVKTELKAVEAEGGGSLAQLGAVSKAAFLGIGVAAAVAAVGTVHMAADFQTAMTRVRTGAGESAANMGLVSRGVLDMAGQVGQSTESLTTGLYTVESAGYHGQQALDVLRVSAMGAKVGAAELSTVTDAVTTAMNAYNLSSADAATNTQNATDVMNALVGTEAEGKTNMEALAGSMASILPVSAAAHVGLNEVLGAMATMTSEGTSADVAATYLRQTIGQLSNPTAKAAAEMKSLGLDSVEVSKNLGTNGLASTLTMLTDAIQSKMGPAGTVLIEHLQKAASNTTAYQKVLANLPPAQQTYIGALATMVGGTKSMQAALQLTGPHMETFQANVKGISEHVKAGGKSVEGWADVQKTFNQKLAEAKGALEAVGIEIGQKLLPYAAKMLTWTTQSIQWLTQHRQVVLVLAAAIGGVLVIGLGAATVAAWNFAAAMLATGIPEIVAGVMLLIGAIVLLVLHWRQAWNWIKTETPLVAKIFHAVWENSLGLFHAAWDLALKAVHAIVQWFGTNVLPWLRDRVAELVSWWKSHSAEISATWQILWTAIQDFVRTAVTLIGDWLHILANVFSTAWRVIWAVVQFVWSNIKNEITAGMHIVMNVISVVMDIITGKWGQAWHDAVHLVSQAFDDLNNFLGGLADSFGNLLYDAGSALIDGLINGIKASGHMVSDALNGIGQSALDGFKSMFGIKSPSRVFADEVGRWIPHGIAVGITANAGVVNDAVTGLSGGAVRAFGGLGGLEPAFAGGGSLGGPYGASVHHTHITVNVDGSVVAERDLASTIQRVMTQHAARNSSTYQPYRR